MCDGAREYGGGVAMQESDGLAEFAPPPAGVVLTMGNFDGVHRGHQQILALARQAADEAGSNSKNGAGGAPAAPVVVVTFEPHPLAILAPDKAPPRLTTRADKLVLLARCGVDATIVLRSESALLSRQAEDFLAEVAARLRPLAIVEGPTFYFGRGRAGSVETLRRHADQYGYVLLEAPHVHCDDLPGRPAVNSSAIRAALRDGQVSHAAALLGRPYRIVGRVGHGESRGAQIGFPTVNLEDIPTLVPGHAVYAAVAQLESGAFHLAAVNIGPQPTFDQLTPRVEAHVVDFSADLRGQRVGLHFLERLRGQVKFSGVEALVAQLRLDVERVQSFAPQVAGIVQASIPV